MNITDKVKVCMFDLIGWKNHYDLTEIPALDVELNTTESGENYQDYHTALSLELIKQSLPPNRDLSEYLTDKVNTGITQLINDVEHEKKLTKYSKKILANEILLNKYGYGNDTIINKSRFVGFRVMVKNAIGLKLVIQKLGLQFVNQTNPLDVYVYHTSKDTELFKMNVTPSTSFGWDWVDINKNLESQSVDYSGGYFVIGYYQDDLQGNAINVREFNWLNGECSTCDGGVLRRKWDNLAKYVSVMPLYVPSGSLDANRLMFDIEDSFEVHDKNWGLNFKFSAECDLSTFYCENRESLRTALGLTVTYSILEDIKYSQQLNHIEENLKHLIIRALEGDSDTNYVNIPDRRKEAIKNIVFDHSSMSLPCLPCQSKGTKIKFI